MTALQPGPRPVLRYHGSKWRIAPWIIAQFPEHRVYIEPFGGGAAVLMRKPRSEFEMYNDLDADVVNVFRVLRDQTAAAELERLLRLTPWARHEFEESYEPAVDEGVFRGWVRSSKPMSWYDFLTKAARTVELFACLKCGGFWFADPNESFRCQCCGAYDGDHHLATHIASPLPEFPSVHALHFLAPVD